MSLKTEESHYWTTSPSHLKSHWIHLGIFLVCKFGERIFSSIQDVQQLGPFQEAAMKVMREILSQAMIQGALVTSRVSRLSRTTLSSQQYPGKDIEVDMGYSDDNPRPGLSLVPDYMDPDYTELILRDPHSFDRFYRLGIKLYDYLHSMQGRVAIEMYPPIAPTRRLAIFEPYASPDTESAWMTVSLGRKHQSATESSQSVGYGLLAEAAIEGAKILLDAYEIISS